MKIKKGFVVREIGGQSFVIALGDASKSMNGMIKLNESARLIWDLLEQGKNKEETINKMLEVYAVDSARAEKDYDRLIAVLKEANVFEAE